MSIRSTPPFGPIGPYVYSGPISFPPWLTDYFEPVSKKSGPGIKIASSVKITSSGAMVYDIQYTFQGIGLGMEMFGLWVDCRTGHSGGSAIGGSGSIIKLTNGGGSMKRSFGLVLLVVFFAVSLGGCSCWPKQAKSEPPAPAPVVQKAAPPAVVQPAPPPKKDRN